jgi:hypothetical protein|tara:strand:+ start:515 stop:895 length:381 start_codon:yes stop_codon:yes gene_type:complete
MFKKIVEQSIENGFFDEVTQEVLNDEEQFGSLVDAFLGEILNNVNELRRKRVIRNKKLKLRVLCPKNKRYNPAKKQCVRVSGSDRVKKRRAMKRAAMKKRGKKAMIKRKRMKSLRKRKAMGLRRGK